MNYPNPCKSFIVGIARSVHMDILDIKPRYRPFCRPNEVDILTASPPPGMRCRESKEATRSKASSISKNGCHAIHHPPSTQVDLQLIAANLHRAISFHLLCLKVSTRGLGRLSCHLSTNHQSPHPPISSIQVKVCPCHPAVSLTDGSAPHLSAR